MIFVCNFWAIRYSAAEMKSSRRSAFFRAWADAVLTELGAATQMATA